jgi:hypothetical protein
VINWFWRLLSDKIKKSDSTEKCDYQIYCLFFAEKIFPDENILNFLTNICKHIR